MMNLGTMTNLSVAFALCLFVGFCSVTGENQEKKISLKDLTAELKTRMYDRRGSDNQVSYLELLYNIINKIEDFRCGKGNVELEQRLDELANNIESVKKDISSQISDIREDFEQKNELVRSELSQTKEDFNGLKQGIESKLSEFKQELNEINSGMGTTYVRWGRSFCPGNGSNVLYRGSAGGSFYSHKGGAASMLCLPNVPMWKNYDDRLQDGGLMYGAEYDDRAASNRESVITKTNHYEQDVQCVVCQVKHRSTTIMIPGRTACYEGWTLEYWGYLMSGHRDFPSATDYYCVDPAQEAVKGRGKNDNGYLLYFVEGRCGSLPCPNYVNGRELTCVVCTK